MSAAAIVLLGSLTSCATAESTPTPTPYTPTTTPSSVPSATPTPTPTPTEAVDPLASVTTVVIRPTGIELVTAAGEVVSEFDYLGSASEAVAALTTVFGFEPEVRSDDGNNHIPPGDTYDWSGFWIDQRFYDEERRTAQGYDNYIWPRFSTSTDVSVVGDVSVQATSGLVIGDVLADAVASAAIDPDVWACEGTPIDSTVVTGAGGEDDLTTVAARADDSGAIMMILAPAMSTTGCA